MVRFVILDEVNPILRLGLMDVLDATGVALVEDLRDADVALACLDAPDARRRAAGLAATFPGLKVISCSTSRPAMLVLGEGAERPCTPSALWEAIECATTACGRETMATDPLSRRRPAVARLGDERELRTLQRAAAALTERLVHLFWR